MNKLEFIRGMIRPFISVSLCLTVIYLAVFKDLNAEKVLELFGIIMAFHFNERAMNKVITKLTPNGGADAKT